MLQFEMLTNLQRDRGLVEIENMPQLRLAPPAVYHEKVQKGTVLSPAESSSDLARIGKQSKTKQLRELKVKGSSLRFPLKSNIFGNGTYVIHSRVIVLKFVKVSSFNAWIHFPGKEKTSKR